MERQLEHEEVMSRKLSNAHLPDVILYTDNVQLANNIAGIFRLADAFAVVKLIISGNNEFIFSKKFRSIARTHEDNIAFEVLSHEDGIDFLHKKKTSYKIIGLEFTDQSLAITNVPKDENIILVIGSESHGISQEVLDICSVCFHIPMLGNISSLNVCTASAICLHELRK